MAAGEAIQGRPARVPLLKLIRENKIAQGMALISPADLYLIMFMVLPLILVTGLSFLSRGMYGEVQFTLHFTNYTRLLDPLYGKILLFSLGVGLGTTVLCILLGYPLA